MRSIPIKRHVFAIVCLVSIPVEASAQSAIMGRVTDTTGHGLPGVRVGVAVPAVPGAALSEIRDVAVTNSTGWFEAANLREGSGTATPSAEESVRDGALPSPATRREGFVDRLTPSGSRTHALATGSPVVR